MPNAMRPSGPGLPLASRRVAMMTPRSPIGPNSVPGTVFVFSSAM